LLVFVVLRLVGGDVGEDVKTGNWGGGVGGAGDDIVRAVRDIEEGEVFNIVKSGPNEFGGLGDDRLKDISGNVERAWIIPSVVRALEDLKDGSGGVHNVLLIDVVKGRPGSNRDMGEGGGGDDSGLRRSE